MDKQNAEEAFVFYRSFFEAMEGLADRDKLVLYDAIARMGLYGEQPELPLEAKRLFVLILPQLKANRKKRVEGRKGGRPAAIGYVEKGTIGSENEKPNEKENEKEKEKEKEREYRGFAPVSAAMAASRARSMPPSLEEIEAYCGERGNQVNPQRFMDFYTSNGWRIGKVPMKDWKAAVRSWETNGMDQRTNPAPAGPEMTDKEIFQQAIELHRMKEAKQV